MSDDVSTKPEPVMLFRGDGTMRIPGVPRRDLTKQDVERLQPDVLREAMASPLYSIVSGAHLPVNRSAIEEVPVVEVPPAESPPATEGSGGAPDGSSDAGRSRRRNAGDGA